MCRNLDFSELKTKCSLFKNYLPVIESERKQFSIFDISVTIFDILNIKEMNSFITMLNKTKEIYKKAIKLDQCLNSYKWNASDNFHLKRWYLITLPICGWIWLLIEIDDGSLIESFGLTLTFPLRTQRKPFKIIISEPPNMKVKRAMKVT
jgi:hypothetical protein